MGRTLNGKKRTVAAVTGSRAEFGLLSGVLRRIEDDTDLRLQLIATGQHLLSEFGGTLREIRADGFRVAARVDLRLRSDSPAAIGQAIGTGVSGFSRVLSRLRPDLLLVLGDRYEVFAAAAAALPLRIPVAHIHGGESTAGAIDDQLRHAVTKLSHLHFPATPRYRQRLLRMGEDPRRVFCFGAPGVENLRRTPRLSREELARGLGLPSGRPWGLMTYHPATLVGGSGAREIRQVLGALSEFPEVFWVCTSPGADIGYRPILAALRAAARRGRERLIFIPSLGHRYYPSMLRHSLVMVGNSSSGIIEAPSFGLPAVNIGARQQGRERGANVIEVAVCERGPIARAVRKALSPRLRARLKEKRNPYSGRATAARIVSVLKRAPLGPALLAKPFYER